MQAFPIDSRDSYAEDGVCVTVEIALVIDGSSIAARKDEYAALSTPAILYTIENALVYQTRRRFHAPAVVRRAPRARIDVVVLIAKIQSGSFVCIGYRRAENADASDFGVIRDAHAADIVFHGADFASASRAMLII